MTSNFPLVFPRPSFFPILNVHTLDACLVSLLLVLLVIFVSHFFSFSTCEPLRAWRSPLPSRLTALRSKLREASFLDNPKNCLGR